MNNPPESLAVKQVTSKIESSFKPGGKIARGTLLGIQKEVSGSSQLLGILESAVREMGATMIENTQVVSTDTADCVSAGVILSESSAFVHVFRKTRSAVAIVFTCGDLVDPTDGVAILDRDLEATTTLLTFHQVGETEAVPEHYIIQ